MYHCLADAERDQFVGGLHEVLRPGGVYYVLCDARRDGYDHGGVPRGEFAERFAERDGWRVEFVAETQFVRQWSTNAAFLAGITRVE